MYATIAPSGEIVGDRAMPEKVSWRCRTVVGAVPVLRPAISTTSDTTTAITMTSAPIRFGVANLVEEETDGVARAFMNSAIGANRSAGTFSKALLMQREDLGVPGEFVDPARLGEVCPFCAGQAVLALGDFQDA